MNFAMEHSAQSPAPLHDWTPPPAPPREVTDGRWARLEPLSAAHHARALYDANGDDERMWDYLFTGPYSDFAPYRAWAQEAEMSEDPFFLAVINKETGRAEGVASFMRITPAHGVIEVGNIAYSRPLRGTRAGTEAMYLMMRTAFQLGYRRYEWKCNALNAPSRKAAARLGFSFEGVFRQHMVVKGKNRDTAWFAVTDRDWPLLQTAYTTWLEPDNFDAEGRQKRNLADLTKPALHLPG